MRSGLRRYTGIVFIAVVIAPAIALSLLAIRAISHEEAYVEKQIEGTLAAEISHVAGVINAELGHVQGELAATVVTPQDGDPSDSIEEWRQRSPLVEVPFLLSPTFEILWPEAGPRAGARGTVDNHRLMGEAPEADEGARPDEGAAARERIPAKKTETAGVGADESDFLESQQAFLTDEERIPVYENIAVAFKDEILGAATSQETETYAKKVTSRERAAGKQEALSSPQATAADEKADTEQVPSTSLGPQESETQGFQGEKARSQAAISQFQQSEPVREKVYGKAQEAGQQILYRNIEPQEPEPETEETGETGDKPGQPAKRASTKKAPVQADLTSDVSAEAERAESSPGTSPPEDSRVARVRSMFISQPLTFSQIVAKGTSGIIPRIIHGRLELIYWQRAGNGNFVGCLIDSRELKERVIGALPGIYSAVRILTVLDERGAPLIIPPGQEDRDWRRPFVAEEISEALPRWEVAAYLTDPDIISSRAHVTTSVLWILILILFASILGGGMLILQSARAEMKLAQQKTSFVANVSHELKTPLTSIRLFAEMLRDGRQRDEAKQKHYLDIMTAETERLTRLINNVLDFARTERGEKRYTMKPCDIVAICAGVVDSQRARLEESGFEVTFSTRAGSLFVNADDEAIKQAIVNLLSNAEKYSTDTKQIEVGVRREDSSAVISISDRGIGIPAGEAKHIFDEFYRVDDTLTSKVKGAGLGLTIARRILKDHGGDIRYESRDGGGSTFEMVLPAIEEEA